VNKKTSLYSASFAAEQFSPSCFYIYSIYFYYIVFGYHTWVSILEFDTGILML